MGIAKSTGEYICFLDDGDYYLPNYLATLAKTIENHNFPIGL